MPKPTEYDKTHLRNMAAIGTRIDRIFKKAAEEAAKIGVSIKKTLPEDRIFSFDDYPETRKQIERLMTALQESMETTIVSGVRSAWTLSNNKNNALVSRIFGDRVGDLSKEQYRRYFSTNGAALDAFIGRKEQGLNLSDRVWRYTNAFKHEIELGLELGIRTGESAASMTRSLRQYLQHPDKLFRRVRDKHGNLRLSKAAQAFHPGRGVYRSSYKNARRLASTETNMAYRTSDHLRWQQMDFVVGIEIRLSNNHTLNGVPLTDICDELKGRYPKDFKFIGWHPHCRCHVVTVLKTEEEMQQDTQRILAGEQPEKGSVNTVRDVPAAFKGWVEEHADRIKTGGNLPYFLRDNMEMVRPILALDKPISVGGKEWTLRELIAECRIEPTENGRIYVHPGHGKNELQENLDFARWRAEQFGEEVVLLPNPQGVKSADSYNITRGVQEEYKRGLKPTKNSISQLIRDGKDQADYLIVEIHPDTSVSVTLDALTSRITDNANPPRCANLKDIRLRIGDYEAVYSRDQIVAKGFKIKPGDFHNVSAPRSQGSSLTSNEAGSISDAKLAKFFGINKKTPQGIAIERHAKRDAEAIQKAWNKRRIANLETAVKEGFLPKECLTGLTALKQEELNARIAALQKAVARHKTRTPQEVADIQIRWEAKQTRDRNTRLIANNVLKLRSEYPNDVDFSVLEKIIADNNLGKMRDEAKMVAQAIKAVRDEEKALSDLIPDVHEWHRQFLMSELLSAHSAIEKAFNRWTWDYTSEKSLNFLHSKLVDEISFVSSSAHKTREIAKKAYEKRLAFVELKQEVLALSKQYDDLITFKTKSAYFNNWMTKAKAALDADDPKTASNYLASAKWKKESLEYQAKKKAEKAGKTASTTTTSTLPEQKDHPTRYESDQERIDQIKDMLGCTEEQAKAYKVAVESFSYEWDWEIRQVQCGNTKFKSMYGHDLADIKERAKDLEEFIEKSPQWAGGTTYRGMSLSDQELANTLDKLKAGTFHNFGSASWSTEQRISKSFSCSHIGEYSSEFGDEKTNRVVLVIKKPKHATSIKHLSEFVRENEVLASARNRYKFVKEYSSTDSYGCTYTYIEVEAI